MTIISARIPDELKKKLEWYAKREKVGTAIALRKIMDIGLKEIKIEHALELYQKGKVTLMKAAEIADISFWEMLDFIREKRIPMHYTIKDAEKDIHVKLKE